MESKKQAALRHHMEVLGNLIYLITEESNGESKAGHYAARAEDAFKSLVDFFAKSTADTTFDADEKLQITLVMQSGARSLDSCTLSLVLLLSLIRQASG